MRHTLIYAIALFAFGLTGCNMEYPVAIDPALSTASEYGQGQEVLILGNRAEVPFHITTVSNRGEIVLRDVRGRSTFPPRVNTKVFIPAHICSNPDERVYLFAHGENGEYDEERINCDRDRREEWRIYLRERR